MIVEQLFLLDGEDIEDLQRQITEFENYHKLKRNYENAFQKWSNQQSQDGYTSLGKCGYGSMCEWCEDNSFGRPCVRALNAMLREKGKKIDYRERNFEKIWYGKWK